MTAFGRMRKGPGQGRQSFPKDILILTSDAGSGHRSASKAVATALQRQYGEQCRVKIINPFHLPKAPAVLRLAERAYLAQIKYTPQLYHFQFEATDTRFLGQLINLGATTLMREALLELLESTPADVVVSVYPIYGHTMATLRKRDGITIPHITVITDLVSVHSAWFEPEDTLCLVPTDAACEKGLRLHMEPYQIKVTGLPVHPDFAQPPADRAALRRSLGWDPERPTALVLAGGAGIGPLVEIAEQIAQRCPYAQTAVVTGKNKEAYEQLMERSWPIPTHVYGFTDQIPALMHASDVLVSRAGGLTVSEGLASGLPIIIYGIVPGQERGNLTYVETHEAGLYAEEPEDVGAVLERWLQPGSEERALYAMNAREAGKPRAAERIAQWIWRVATREVA
ncbi:MAG: galactosyldiacylglycerol synthase [Anaerolineae bacterium]|nr:galactosyldiacylglycerol synthase [Anaerolineae bacterium]